MTDVAKVIADGEAGARRAAAEMTVALCAETTHSTLSEDCAKVDLKISFRSFLHNGSLLTVHCQVKSGRSFRADSSTPERVTLQNVDRATISALQDGTQPSLLVWVPPKPSGRIYWHLLLVNKIQKTPIKIPRTQFVTPVLRFDLSRYLAFTKNKTGLARVNLPILSLESYTPRKARAEYAKLKKANVVSPIAGKIEITRFAWRHITRKSRSGASRLRSFSLIPYLGKILQKVPSRYLVSNQKIEHSGKLTKESRELIFWYNRAIGHDGIPCNVLVRMIEEISYDCGSSDSPAVLHREIERLRHELTGRNRIDVLVLSHFDRDHVNGVKELLKHFRVDRLFIPYVPLEKRLLLVFEETVRDHEFVESVVNPARHLAEAGGDNLGQVIYVVGGEHGKPPEAFRVAERPPEFRFESGIKYPRDSTEEVSPGEAIGSGESWVSKTLYVSDREPLAIVGLWEFVFFNKESKRATDEFTEKVRLQVDKWKWGEWFNNDPEAFVLTLKSLYEDEFPKGRARNDISLVTYSGPISDTWANCYSCLGDLYPAHRSLDFPLGLMCHYCRTARAATKASHLYFGDLTLTKTLLEKKLRQHLGDERWSRILSIQVPHHGAKSAWFKNAAKSFHGLSAMVRNRLGLDPLSGAAYLFTNKSRNRVS